MTNQDVINFLNQVRKILLDDKSWLESTIQPINEAFDMAINALEQLNNVPSAQPRSGKWRVINKFEDCWYVKCNQCNATQVFYYNKPLTNFCPECGAKMEGEG